MKLVFVASLSWCLAGLGVLLSWDFFWDLNPSIGIVVLMLFVILIGLTRRAVGAAQAAEKIVVRGRNAAAAAGLQKVTLIPPNARRPMSDPP